MRYLPTEAVLPLGHGWLERLARNKLIAPLLLAPVGGLAVRLVHLWAPRAEPLGLGVKVLHVLAVHVLAIVLAVVLGVVLLARVGVRAELELCHPVRRWPAPHRLHDVAEQVLRAIRHGHNPVLAVGLLAKPRRARRDRRHRGECGLQQLCRKYKTAPCGFVKRLETASVREDGLLFHEFLPFDLGRGVRSFAVPQPVKRRYERREQVDEPIGVHRGARAPVREGFRHCLRDVLRQWPRSKATVDEEREW